MTDREWKRNTEKKEQRRGTKREKQREVPSSHDVIAAIGGN